MIPKLKRIKGNTSCEKRRKIFYSTGGRCFYCGCKLQYDAFQLDHVVPVSYGCSRCRNLVPSCWDCNHAKSSMTVDEFREYIENNIFNMSHIGSLIKKYYGKPRKKVVFFFEKNPDLEIFDKE